MFRALRNWPTGMQTGLIRDYFRSAKALNEFSEFRSIERVCAFVGHSRSGHSIVASILDAHRHIVLADEIHAIRYTALPFTTNQIYWLLLENARKISALSRKRAGYDFAIPNQWQGSFESIRVIGEKDGSVLATIACRNEALIEQFFQKFEGLIKVIHLYRNPFDVISTIQKRHLNKFGPQPLDKAIDYVFRRQIGIEMIRKRSDIDLIDVCFERFLAKPGQYLRRLCDFLGVDSPESYISDSCSILYSEPRKTRYDIDWDKAQKNRVLELAQAFPYLHKYTFED